MDPVISTVLQALAAGAQAIATGIATDEAKRIYNQLKALIQQNWSVKPPAEKLITEYEKDPDSQKQVLAEKLEQEGVSQDQHILQKAKQLLQTISTSTTVDQSRTASSGHTATTGATISLDTISAGQNAYKVDGNFNQSITYSRRTRLVILLGILTIILAGVIVYLIRNEKFHLPRILLSPNSPPQIEEASKLLPYVNTDPSVLNPNSFVESKESPDLPQDVNTSPSTSGQGASVKDIDIQVRNLAKGDRPDFVGEATNIGKTEIAEFFVIAIVAEMTIRPEEFRNSKLVTVIDRVRNLKPGESRKISGYFNLWEARIEEFPKKYKDKDFKYTVNWSRSYKWYVTVAAREDLSVCWKNRTCAQKYL